MDWDTLAIAVLILAIIGTCAIHRWRVEQLREEAVYWKLQYEVTRTTFETYRRLVNEGVEKEIREELASTVQALSEDENGEGGVTVSYLNDRL